MSSLSRDNNHKALFVSSSRAKFELVKHIVLYNSVLSVSYLEQCVRKCISFSTSFQQQFRHKHSSLGIGFGL